MLELRLDGLTYREIAEKAGVSRQRVQQSISPPRNIRNFVVGKYGGRCNRCDILVGKSGHVHHNGDLSIENYNDLNSLELLCLACHRKAHAMTIRAENFAYRMPQTQITISTSDLLTVADAAHLLGKHIATIYRWHKAGQIIGVEFGGILFIPQSEILRLKK